MEKEIQIHQVLHGYHNGHQLLASSKEFSFTDRRLLDSLSDGAGIDSVNCIEGYITGYALPEAKKYVLAKTWYADDMVRPGCVWTHSLLIDIEDMKSLYSPNRILKLFRRPIKDQYKSYMKSIYISEDNMDRFSGDLEKLAYVIYTIYATDRNRYIEIGDNSDVKNVIWAMRYMPKQLLKDFSFCSNSLVNRRIDGRIFSYQMIETENLYRVCSNINESRLYRQQGEDLKTPAWAREYVKIISEGKLSDIEVFMRIFDKCILEYSTFNQLLRLYFITNNLGENILIDDYYKILKRISEKNYILYFQCIISELINGVYFDELFLDYFVGLLGIMEKNRMKMKSEDRDKLVKKLLDKKVDRIPEFLDGYIHGTLSKQKAKIAHQIIMQAKPEDLKYISNMNHDIVIVAVATNNKLIMSKDIWSCSRDYQCDVLNVLDEAIAYNNWLRILSLILEESKEDISEVVYNKAKDKLVPLLLTLFQRKTRVLYDEQLLFWDKYLLVDQINLAKNLLQIVNEGLRKHLLLSINTYDREVRRALSSEEWTELFLSCDFKREKQDIAIKMLPLVLDQELLFSIEIVAFVFGTIHQALAELCISYEDWSMFEAELPTVDLCYAWDKCLRLRRAFENKGYCIEKLFLEYDLLL